MTEFVATLTDAQRYKILCSMTEGLHALLFGTASLNDPEVSHNAICDNGTIHEYVHAMIYLLPPTDPNIQSTFKSKDDNVASLKTEGREEDG